MRNLVGAFLCPPATSGVSLLRRTQFVAAVCAILAAVFLGLLFRAESQLTKAEEKISSQSERLMEYASLDDRGEALRRGVRFIDYQKWTEQMPRFVERRGEVTCVVERRGDAFQVSKFRASDPRVVVAHFSFGGPDACDRIQM